MKRFFEMNLAISAVEGLGLEKNQAQFSEELHAAPVDPTDTPIELGRRDRNQSVVGIVIIARPIVAPRVSQGDRCHHTG